MPRVYAILNPASGRGQAAKHKRHVLQALDAAGLEHELVETNAQGDGIELARRASQTGYDVVAAIGGDGTVSEVMNGLYQAAAPDAAVGTLAVFATGSGNDFADMLRVPKAAKTVAQRIAAGSTCSIDLGIVDYRADGQTHHRAFDNNIGLGFEAQVTLESNKIRSVRGTLLYLVAALHALRAYTSPRLTIEWHATTLQRSPWNDALAARSGRGGLAAIPSSAQPDNAAHSDNADLVSRTLKALMVSIGNSARTGGGFYLTPNARLDDGLLDLAIARKISRWRILNLLPKTLFGKHTSDAAVEMATCRRVRITCHDPVPMHLDGEVVTENLEWVDIHIEPGRLHVVV